MERGGSVYFYHRDGLGSVSEVSDQSGTLVERYVYDVYGRPQIFDSTDSELTASAIGNPYLFTGRRYDPESGNYYYRARIYSPTLGRFLQSDPLGYVDGLNLYAYVGNNPLVYAESSVMRIRGRMLYTLLSLLNLLQAFYPIGRLSFQMHHGKNKNFRAVNIINNPIRKHL